MVVSDLHSLFYINCFKWKYCVQFRVNAVNHGGEKLAIKKYVFKLCVEAIYWDAKGKENEPD